MTLRWGLIGGSDIAATRMIPAMRSLGHQVTAVASSNKSRAESFAQAQDIPVAADDSTALVGRDDVDAVYISSVNHLHTEHTLAAVAAGKHVLCEKPLALNLSDAWSMVNAADRAKVVFGVNHHLPSHTTHSEIRRLVSSGAVGEPMAVRVFFAFQLAERLRGWRLTDPDLGGPILDLEPHIASVVNKLLGRPLDATAVAVRRGSWGPNLQGTAEDTAMSVIRYEGDALSESHIGWTVPFARNGLEVHGTAGSIVATDVMRADPGGRVLIQDASGAREVEFAHHRDAYEVTLESFAEAVAGRGEPAISGLEGLRAVAVALAIKESAAAGHSVPIQFDPPESP